MEIINTNAEEEFREAERKKLTPTVTTLKRTRYYTTTHNDLAVTTEIKEYTKKTTYVYPVGQKPPELDKVSLKDGHVQEENKCSKKFRPIGSVELDVLYKANHPLNISVDDVHSGIYPLRRSGSATTSFTSKDFQISDSENVVSEKVFETCLNHPSPDKMLQFEASDRESVGPETCKINRLSYNQALRDERVKTDDSDTSSSSSSSSSSGTFADSSSHESIGTHKKSFLPKFLNFCKGADTYSIDGRTIESPDSEPIMDKIGIDDLDLPTCTSDRISLKESSHSHGDNTTSSTTSVRSEKEVEIEFIPPELCMDLPSVAAPEVEVEVEAEVESEVQAQLKLSSPSLDQSLHSVTPPCISVSKEVHVSAPKMTDPSIKTPKPKRSFFSLCAGKPLTTSLESLDIPKISVQTLSDLEHSVPELSSVKSISIHSHQCAHRGDLPAVPMQTMEVTGICADLQVEVVESYRIPGMSLGPDGTIYGPDGCPFGTQYEKDSEGQPALGPEGHLMGPDGPILGLDGEPLSEWNTIAADGSVFGPDGEPLLGLDGEPVRCGLDADGQLLLGPDGALLGPEGKPLCGPKLILGNTIAADGTMYGADGTVILGQNGEPLVCGFDPDGRPMRSPDGALLGPDGILLVAQSPKLEEPEYELDCKSVSVKSLDVDLGVHAADRVGTPEANLSAQVRTPLDIFPKARRLKEPKQPKYNPFKPGNICGRKEKSESVEKPVKPKRGGRGLCLGGMSSPDLTHVSRDFKDDTLAADDKSLTSLESFEITSSLIREPPIPSPHVISPECPGFPEVEVDVDAPEILPDVELNVEAAPCSVSERAVTPTPLGLDTAIELARGVDIDPPCSDQELSLPKVKPICTLEISKPLENDKLKSVDDDVSIGRVSSRLTVPKVKEKKRFKLPGPCGGTRSPDISVSCSIETELKPVKQSNYSYPACCGGNRAPSPAVSKPDIVPLTSPSEVPEPFSGTVDVEVDVSAPVVSVTHTELSIPEKRRGSGVLGGIFDLFRGRKAKRAEAPLTRSHSIPASIYSSTESLYVVTYKIKKRRTQSCPPRKRGKTHITIECEYDDAAMMMAPRYITEVMGTIEDGDTEALKDLKVVPYHQKLLKELKDFKKEDEDDVTTSHIYTTCHCVECPRVSVGVSTECDIIQHEAFLGEPVQFDGETAEASCQTDPDTTEYNAEECTCQLCQALAAHLSEIALTMGVGDEPIHLYVHVCQTCPALQED